MGKVTLICAFAIASLFLASVTCQSPTMPASSAAIQDQLTSKLKLIVNSPAESKLELEATVENHAAHDITVLSWNSLLDPSAGLVGILSIKDTQTTDSDASTIDIPKIMFNRRRPPPDEDYILIKAGGQVTNIFEVSVTLNGGRQYEISAEGHWHEVWNGGKQEDESKLTRNVPFVSEVLKITT